MSSAIWAWHRVIRRVRDDLSRLVGHEWSQDPALGDSVGHQLVGKELVEPSETLRQLLHGDRVDGPCDKKSISSR